MNPISEESNQVSLAIQNDRPVVHTIARSRVRSSSVEFAVGYGYPPCGGIACVDELTTYQIERDVIDPDQVRGEDRYGITLNSQRSTFVEVGTETYLPTITLRSVG